MKPGFFLTLFVTAILITVSCKENLTENDNKIKAPNEMKWSADTLAYPDSPQTSMTQICAFTTKDIYVVGWCSVVRGEMYHFNGNNWSPVDLANDIGGHRINRLLGLAPNNIWSVGYEGEHNLIAHYNGTYWEKINTSTKGNLLAVDGDSPNNIYACGREGVVYYYDGTKWKYDQFVPLGYASNAFQLHGVAVYKGETFLIGRAVSSEKHIWKEYFIRGKYQNWKIVDSMNFANGSVRVKWGFYQIKKGSNGKLYSSGSEDIFEWNNEAWKALPQPRVGGSGIFIKDDNYMVALGGGADFYNGVIWQAFPPILDKNEGVFFSDAWTDGKEMFLTASLSKGITIKTIIFHGK